jgi:CheY-like chemotaxis protein
MNDNPSGVVVAVVDDDQSVLRSLEYLLESADYGVRLFTSGADLLASASLQEIDCLISDIDMPGIDGLELLRLVQVAPPGTPEHPHYRLPRYAAARAVVGRKQPPRLHQAFPGVRAARRHQ